MIKRHFLTLYISFLGLTSLAQETNVFLDRKFWKQNPSIETIKSYIEKGNDPTELNPFAFDAVTWALLEKTDNKTIKYLLSLNGNGVNKLTHDGRTYIFWAAYKDNLEMMQYLIDHGAKTDIIDDHGYSVLNFAANTGQTNIALYDFLIKHGATPKTETNHKDANAILLVAPFLNNFELVEYFISKGISLDYKDKNGNGIFNYASKGGNINFLKQLIAKGLLPKELNKNGGNAVLMASKGTRGRQNSLEVYHFLEDNGIAINVTNDNGKNPLHYIANKSKDAPLYNYFICKGASVNAQDEDGNSPFMNAVNRNTLAIVKLLVKEVKYIDEVNKKGQSALTMAVNRNTPEVVAFLLEQKADATIVDKNGNNLAYYLMNAYSEKDPKAFEAKLKLLQQHNLKHNQIQANGNTLYHIAVEKGNLALLKRINDFNMDVNAKNKDGLSPLHLASMKAKDTTIMEYLISIGADISAKTDFEETVYDLAKENELLKKSNTDISFLK